MEASMEVDTMAVTESPAPVKATHEEVEGCLICGESELDEAMLESEFTPNILRCLLTLLNLSLEEYDIFLSNITFCLGCGVKLRQIYVLNNQLIDIQNQLKDFRLQIESDLVLTFMQSTTLGDSVRFQVKNSSNSTVRRKIFKEIRGQTCSTHEGSFINGLTELQDENTGSTGTGTDDFGKSSPSPPSPEFEFNSDSPLCDPLLTEDDVKIDTEIDNDEKEMDFEYQVESGMLSVLPSVRPMDSTDNDNESSSVYMDKISREDLDTSESPIPSMRLCNELLPCKNAADGEFEKVYPILKLHRIAIPKKKSVGNLKKINSKAKVQKPKSQGSFTCTTRGCNRKFTTPLLRRNHISRYHSAKSKGKNLTVKTEETKDVSEGNFACTEEGCKKSFATNIYLKRHLRRFHKVLPIPKVPKRPRRKPTEKSKAVLEIPSNSESRYVCDKCGKTLRTRNAFKNHLKSHQGFRFHCKHCGKGHNYKVNLEAHEVLHTGELPFGCTYCGLAFRTQKAVRNHQLREHEEFFVNGKSVFECEICKLVLSSNPTLKHHMMKHSGCYDFRCEICGAGCPSRRTFEYHMKTHRDERNLSCSVCQKKFKFKANLIVHLRSHTGERPYQCKSCPKNYIDRAALRKHVTAVHNDGAATFVCHLCGKVNPSNHYLTVHLRSHKLKEERAAAKETTGISSQITSRKKRQRQPKVIKKKKPTKKCETLSDADTQESSDSG